MEGCWLSLILIHYPGICLKILKETTKNHSRCSRSSDRDMKPAPHQSEAGLLITRPLCSVCVLMVHTNCPCVFFSALYTLLALMLFRTKFKVWYLESDHDSAQSEILSHCPDWTLPQAFLMHRIIRYALCHSAVAERLSLLLRIRECTGSNLRTETAFTVWGFATFLSLSA